MVQSNCTDKEEVGKSSKIKSGCVNANDEVSMAHSNRTDPEGSLTVLNNTKDTEIAWCKTIKIMRNIRIIPVPLFEQTTHEANRGEGGGTRT